MNRILLERAESRPDGSAVFGGARAAHVVTVLHGAVGQSLKTGDVNGKVGTSVITSIADDGTDAEGHPAWRIAVDCRHGDDPLPPWCDLILAPPRPRVMKRLLPQLATLGVRRIFLVGAEKVEKDFWGAQILKEEIYRPLLVEGLMQGAVSTALPVLELRKNFRHWLARGDFEATFVRQTARIVAHPPERGTVPISDSEKGTVPVSDPSEMGAVPVFAIGPEGGWTDGEIALLTEHGFRCYGLGPRILRTETAVAVLLGCHFPDL